MAITIKDIQEKVFPYQAVNGYDVEQVDDFLDEITEQLSAMIRENLQLKTQLNKAQTELGEKERALADAVSKKPDYNEEGYFRNLQNAMRDSLISAQRVADEATVKAKTEAEKTVSDAKAEAEKLVADAHVEAERITRDAETATTNAKAEYESLKTAADEYRSGFRRLIENQLEILKANDLLFK